MTKTTIELTQERKEQLRDARKEHESNYDQTLARLLGESRGGRLWTEQEIKNIVDQRIQEAKR